MEFSIKDCAYTRTKQVRLTYHDLLGHVKYIQRTVNPEDLLNPNTNFLSYLQKTLTKQAKEDLADQAIMMSNQVTERINNMVSSPYYVYNSNMFTGGTSATDNSIWYNTFNEITPFNWANNVTNLYETIEQEIEIEIPLGKRSIIVKKLHLPGKKVIVTEDDIVKAMQKKIEECKFQIITKRAERRAEDLLQSMISEIDFRSYKEKGFFLVKSSNRLFKIYKDKNKWIDFYEQCNKEFIPKNRLCTHTATRDLPDADEALSKLLLIRSGRILDHSNLHSINGNIGHYVGEEMNIIIEKDLLLLNS